MADFSGRFNLLQGENPFTIYPEVAWIESGKGAEDGLDFRAEMGDGLTLGHFATLDEARAAIAAEATARLKRVQIRHIISGGEEPVTVDDEEVGSDNPVP